MTKKLLVVLPAYNEELTLPPLLDEFYRVFPAINRDCGVLIVNDGSTDKTGNVLEEYANKYPSLTVETHEQNRGLGPTVLTGLQKAVEHLDSDEDVIICMDADNTHPPDVVPLMLEKIAAGADIVIASRYRKGSKQVGVPFFRKMLSLGGRVIFTLMLRLPGVRDYTCGFRAYRFNVVRLGLEQYGDKLIERSGFACTDELLVKLAPHCNKIEEVPFILRYDRKEGESKLPLWETIKATLALIFKKH